MTATIAAAGPLGAVLSTDRSQLHGARHPLRIGANPLILIRRAVFVDAQGRLDKDARNALLRWAQEFDLGQDDDLIRLVGQRRASAVAAQADAGGHARLLLRPLWRLAVGLGDRTNPYEFGLSLHGTYGWPIIPGSTIKGVTRAWAAQNPEAAAPDLVETVFGPQPAGDRDLDPGGGTTTFLDALPVGGRVRVIRDVVTPHVQPYYRTDRPEPPAEWHNPIPTEFLVIEGGTFAVDLLGPADHVAAAAGWCASAVDDLGVGGKTAAGYGYLQATSRPGGSN